MRYMGSKGRFAKALVPEIMRWHHETMPYVEPFVGGGNMICKIPAVPAGRTGYDANKYVVALLEAVRDGYHPPEHISEEIYNDVRDNPDSFSPALVGFVGTACTFGSKWFGGYARTSRTGERVRDYCAEGRAALLKQAPSLYGIRFKHSDYKDIQFVLPSLIYCDPPYADTDARYQKGFDSAAFWRWADDLVEAGHRVYVSEYEAPDHWRCIWNKPLKVVMNGTNSKHATERLYTRGKSFDEVHGQQGEARQRHSQDCTCGA